MNIETVTSFKIVLIGDGGVGKTSFLKRYKDDGYDQKYIATIGAEVYPIKFNTNYGKIIFNCWDCAGQEKFAGLKDGYYIKADAAITFFDITRQNTFKNIESWITSFKRIEKAPIVICGNKCDDESIDRKVTPMAIRNKISRKFYCEISAKTKYNLEEPFLKLAKILTGHDDLYFKEMAAIVPVEIIA